VSSITTLYLEELKATMRGTYAWLGAGILLLAVGGLATVATQDTWLDGYGIVTYGLLPLAFVPIAACVIASPRANRFVECVFTAPVSRGSWLVAKLLVLATLAAAFYAALLPMLAVYAAHVGVPFLLRKFLVWSALLLVASLASGTLVGVLFIERSIAAPAGAGVGVLLMYAALMPLQELLVAQGNGATRTGHLTLMSPLVLFKNALGFALVAPSVPSTRLATWIVVAAIVGGQLALAAWIYLRAQGVETWEAGPRQRVVIGVAIAAIAIAPVMAADANYDTPAPPVSNAPAVRGLFSRAGAPLALVRPGAAMPARCCGTILNRDEWPPFSTGEDTRRDLLILLPVETSERVSDLHVSVTGESGLQITTAADRLDGTPPLETRTYANDTGPTGADGRRVRTGWIVRVPVTLNPTHPWDIGGDRYPLMVTATYRAGDDVEPRTLNARAAVDAQVGGAIYEMGLASMVCPAVCLIAAFVRWRRTR